MNNRNIAEVYRFLLCMMALILVWPDARADEWGVGLVTQSYQATTIGADRVETGVLPFLYYKGNHLAVDFKEISYKLIKYDYFEIAALGQVRFQSYDPDNTSALEGMDERYPAFDAGVRLAYGGQQGAVSLSAVTDVSDHHNGQEIRATYGFTYRKKRWAFEPSLGLSWLSEDLVDYYYGVRSSEALPDRPAYTGNAATNVFTGLTASFKIARNVFAFSGAEYRYLGENIRKSLIIEKDFEVEAFAGLLYRF